MMHELKDIAMIHRPHIVNTILFIVLEFRSL